jgi:hypothetical protein
MMHTTPACYGPRLHSISRRCRVALAQVRCGSWLTSVFIRAWFYFILVPPFTAFYIQDLHGIEEWSNIILVLTSSLT